MYVGSSSTRPCGRRSMSRTLAFNASIRIPQQCLNLDGYVELVERETLSSVGDWSLLDQKVQLAGFEIKELVNSSEISVDGGRVKYRGIDTRRPPQGEALGAEHREQRSSPFGCPPPAITSTRTSWRTHRCSCAHRGIQG